MRYLLIGLLGLLSFGILYSCKKELSVEYGTAAKGSLQSSAGDCLPKAIGGSYVAAKSLNDSNYLDVTVNVTATGPYKIFTDTVNGYSFLGTGTFSNTGTNTVRLKGSGQALSAGTDDFTVYFDSSFCDVTVIVLPAGGSSCGANVQGTYTAGTALTAANKVTFTHTYATAGNYSVSTSTVNGYSFSLSSYTATAGSNTVTLTATGTPTAAGTNNFTVNFGDGQTCSFAVTVSGVPNTDYFPTTQGSYWTYDDVPNSDTFKVTVSGTQSITIPGNPAQTNTYQKFEYSDASGPFYTEYYRKDAGGYYYQAMDTSGFGQAGIAFNQKQFEVVFLKNVLSNGAPVGPTDINITYNGTPAILRFKYSCVDANNSKTVNGKVFTNVYKMQQDIQVIVNSAVVASGGPNFYYYAKGVGLISGEDKNGAAQQSIRYWQVN